MPEDRPTKLTIRPPEILSIPLPNGQHIDVLKYHYFLNSEEIRHKAHDQPILIKLPIEVTTTNGTWHSEPRWVLFGHGYRDAKGEHVLEPNGLSSEAVVTALASKMGRDDPNERLALFVACDADNAQLRWDEGQKGRALGVIGVGGGINHAHTDARGKLILDVRDFPNSVFSDPNHPNRFLINHPRFTFVPGKITIR